MNMDLSGLYPCFAEAHKKAQEKGQACLAVFSIKIKDIDPLDVLRRVQVGAEPYALWETDDHSSSLFGWGTAITLRAVGDNRFASLKALWARWAGSAIVHGPLVARAIGGFRFDTQGPKAPDWEAFEDSDLTLHKWVLVVEGGSTYMLAHCVIESGDEPREWVKHYQELAAWCQRSVVQPDGHSRCESVSQDISEECWTSKVERAVDCIRQGSMSKVVLARSVRYAFDRPVDVAAVMTTLRATSGSHLFAIRRCDSCFLGATPERLISLAKGRVQTLALAGTARRDQNPEADIRLGGALMDSVKERHEHALVVRAIEDALQPFVTQLDVPREPELRRLKNVQHLSTPISARIDENMSVLDLVGALHPTPAVAGDSKQPALLFIREHEELDRGWYAAPVGWMDAHGEGDFVVALRSALLDQNACHLFAGCGIVAQSDAKDEYRETCLKLSSMQDAILQSARVPSKLQA